jgi:hypothetical protein
VLREHLVRAIETAPAATPYYESFAAAFEALLVADGVLTNDDIAARTERARRPDSHHVG